MAKAKAKKKPVKKTTKKTKTTGFAGFGPDMVGFLAELSHNNNRDWFTENKQRYEDEVREPARAFIRAMAPKLKKLSPHLVADDRKVGGSLMRVHRDIRFSKDKTPYKTNVGIQFRHAQGKDVHAPGAYVHVGLEGCFVGVGIWRPESAALGAIRKRIADDPKLYTRIMSAKGLKSSWQSGGDSLKRPPKGFDKEHPLIDELKRKDHILVADLTLDQAESKDLIDLVMARFKLAKKHTKFLCEAIGVPY